MKKTITIEAFIKAVDKEYFDAFLNHGEICLNTLKTFQKLESLNDAIGDKYEGASHVIGKEATIKIAPLGKFDQFKTLSDSAEDVLFYKDGDNGNILSLYSISNDNEIHVIPEEFIKEFNNHRFCLISAPGLFLEKLNNEIIKKGFTPTTMAVSYFPTNNNLRSLNPFEKRNKYAYQKETRVYFNDPMAERQIFKIGSMRDFAFEIFPNKYMYKIDNQESKAIIIKMGKPLKH
jgi:hypothetical protein